MPTLNGIEYGIQSLEDVAAGTKAMTIPEGATSAIIGIVGTGDPTGVLTIGGVSVPSRIAEEHYGRLGCIYSLYSGLEARTDDNMTMSGFSGTLQIFACFLCADGSGAHGGNTEYTGWADWQTVSTTIGDAHAGAVYQVGGVLAIGEASLGHYTTLFGPSPGTGASSSGAEFVHVGQGGAYDTGGALGVFVQGPGEDDINMGFAYGSSTATRFWVATAGWVGGPASSGRRKVPSILVL